MSQSFTAASSFVVMSAPKTKFPSSDAALPFTNTIITNYGFPAILKTVRSLNAYKVSIKDSAFF